ncbi:hypothetical protein C8J27_106196 [Rhodobacter aestuarii]|uniref:Uncharacterized protein n=1 Tax=Rhodobacter aestuarii TaxID=453582 RepID=A0A1N7M8W4_9RHOB|nr:hypothetical protein [Rhodobacter aestuarii]PTV94927.1 hypothetical protein C8J27_106196 [Rhodobacter aestuarii]SIS82555.1 hypothetical protein SAMN05421580_105196 [Rhodobacter aestuarii]
MQFLDASFAASLAAAPEAGLVPVHFVWIVGRDRESGAAVPIGLWSGAEEISIEVAHPGGAAQRRDYIGGCGFTVEGLRYVADLTDNAVSVALSAIADPVRDLLSDPGQGLDLRLAYVEIHATTMTGGAFTSAPQLQWVGIVDDGPLSTPAAGGEGGIALSIRSEIMTQLGMSSPAKSSDAHQKRRAATDRFCEAAALIGARTIQWYKT